MAVAHDAVSESVDSVAVASFTFSHNPVGTPRGVLVFVFTPNFNADYITSVTYDGIAMTRVTGGQAIDTAGEPGRCDTFFLGASVPATDPANIVVTRTNNAAIVYATAATVTAAADTEVTGIVLVQGDGTLAEQSVDDGSPGTNSVRYAGVYFGDLAVPAAGANSTALIESDFGQRTASMFRETTAGQGARSVGAASGATSDDRAAVHLAVREAATNATVSPGSVASVAAVPAPTPLGAAVTEPSVVAAVGAVPAPTILVGGDVVALPSVVAAIGAIDAPTVLGAAVASLTEVAVLAGVPAPVIAAGAIVSVETVAAIASVPAPTILAEAIVTPSVVAVLVVVGAPTILADARAPPSTVAVLAAVESPTILAGAIASPATLAGVATVEAPSVTGTATPTPASVAAIAAVDAPSVSGTALVGAATVEALAAVPAPVIDVGGGNATAAPSTTIAVAAVDTPTILGTAIVAPATAVVLAGVGSPVVAGAAATVPATVAVLANVGAPVVITTTGDTLPQRDYDPGRVTPQRSAGRILPVPFAAGPTYPEGGG